MADQVVIAPQGELDIHAARGLSEAFQQAVGSSDSMLVVDLSGVTFLDSTGLGTVLKTFERLRRQGRTMKVIAPAGSPAAAVIDLAGVRSMLQVSEA
jgi:anti-sigma B factor antagonist